MVQVPETRVSLIVRLPDGADIEAWREFADTYEPFVYRFARRRGLQDADARELVQEVFLGVAKAVKRWQPAATGKQARFRTWLFRIARNQLINQLSRRHPECALDSVGWQQVEGPPPQPRSSEHEQAEYRQEVFRWASARVQARVKPITWRAFWQTSVVGRDIDDVAAELGVPRGTIYVARSRVISKLRAEILRFESEDG